MKKILTSEDITLRNGTGLNVLDLKKSLGKTK